MKRNRADISTRECKTPSTVSAEIHSVSTDLTPDVRRRAAATLAPSVEESLTITSIELFVSSLELELKTTDVCFCKERDTNRM